jgi:hypothetical protein
MPKSTVKLQIHPPRLSLLSAHLCSCRPAKSIAAFRVKHRFFRVRETLSFFAFEGQLLEFILGTVVEF